MFGLKGFPRVARSTLLSLFSLLLVLQAASCAPSAGGESSVNVPDNASGSTPEGRSDEPHGQEGFMEEGFVMEKNGVLFCDVVIPDSAGEKETAAAGDLRKYIGKMTGETPKIVRESKISDGKKHIFVGGTARAAELGIEKPSGYPGVERVLVLQRENDLFVLGNDDGNYNGTQFAVNMLLEHLGCGWFGEGEMWEIVPELKDIDLTGLEIDHSPRFNSRITRVFGGQFVECAAHVQKIAFGTDFAACAPDMSLSTFAPPSTAPRKPPPRPIVVDDHYGRLLRHHALAVRDYPVRRHSTFLTHFSRLL